MARTARKKAESQTYHIVLRGINKQTIFYDDEDRVVFLNRIKQAKEGGGISVYAFCLMSNHVHLLIKEEQDDALGSVFRKILSSFVFWYNRKYKRVGNLFQDRYRSEAIESEGHLLCAVRYIHQNPLKAEIVDNINDYRWSSHSAYLNNVVSFVDKEFALSILGGVNSYVSFMEKHESGEFIEDSAYVPSSDEEVELALRQIMNNNSFYELQKCKHEEIKSVILELKQKVPSASIRQISRVTGISVGVVRYI